MKIQNEYFTTHSARYHELIKVAKRYQPKKILVVGGTHEVQLLRNHFPKAIIDGMGFDKNVAYRKYVFADLNLPFPSALDGDYDLVVCCEVMEHLTKEAKTFVTELLALGRSVLVQTPNAACLYKRLWAVIGKSPYQIADELKLRYGHLREYTYDELRTCAKVDFIETKNYFRHQRFGLVGSLYTTLCNMLPKRFRDGVTVVYSK